MFVGECQTVAHLTTQTLSKLRLNDAFSKFWETNLRETKRLEIENPVLPCNKRSPIRYVIGNAHDEFSDMETNYRQIYFKALDTMISCITSRFNQKDYFKYHAKMQSLLLLAANSKELQQDLSDKLTFMVTTSTDVVYKCNLQLYVQHFKAKTIIPSTFRR